MLVRWNTSITLFNCGERAESRAQQIRAIKGETGPPPPEETLLLLDKFSNMQLWESTSFFLFSFLGHILKHNDTLSMCGV